MIYNIEVSDELDKIFLKLSKKNKNQLRIIWKKIREIKTDPYHYKPLKGSMKGIWRVHIDKHFVLTYEIKNKTIRFLDYDHHDNIY